MAQREMSARQYALWLGVDPTTVTRAIDMRKPAKPGLEFLLRMSSATKFDIGTLVKLAYPEVDFDSEVSPSAELLARQIEAAPDSVRAAINALIRTTADGEWRDNADGKD